MTTKTQSKKTTTKTQSKKTVAQAESIESFDDYKKNLLQYAEDYKQRRLEVEKKPLAANKMRECKKFNLALLTNEAIKILYDMKFDYKTFKTLRLNFYSKALAEVVRFLNALASGEFTDEKANCIALTLAALQDASEKQLYYKKQLSYNCKEAGKNGGSDAHACMLGELVELFGFGSYNKQEKIIKLNNYICNLFNNLNIFSEDVTRIRHDSTAL